MSSPADTKAPLASSLHTRDWPEIVALLCAVVQELVGDLGGDGVVAIVGCGHFTVAVTQEASHGLSGVESQRLLEDVQALGHGGGVVAVRVVERLLGVVM